MKYLEPPMKFEVGLMKYIPYLFKKEKSLLTFDLDETLIHAKKAHWLAFNEAFKISKLPKIKYSKISKLLDGRHAHEIIKNLFPRLDKNSIDKITELHRKFIYKKYGKYAKPITGAIKTLKKLKKDYLLALVTNCNHNEADSFLKAVCIDKGLFDTIVGKDDVKRSKPYPDEFLKVEQRLKTKILFHIGDSIYDIIAARRAGIKVISVLTGVTKKEKLKKEKPYKIIKSIKELDKIL